MQNCLLVMARPHQTQRRPLLAPVSSTPATVNTGDVRVLSGGDPASLPPTPTP